MDSALAAASLLLAIVALIFSAWQGDIATALGRQRSTDKSKTEAFRAEALATLRQKAAPLAVGAVLAATVFGYRALKIVLTLRFATTPGYEFDDIGAAFVLTELFVVLIAVVAVGNVMSLRKIVSALTP